MPISSACPLEQRSRCLRKQTWPSRTPAPPPQERLGAVLKQLNADAALLKACLLRYTAWLQRQRQAAAAAGLALPAEPGSAVAARESMAVEGPPAGAFPHREAVDAWLRLTEKVITAGLWFLLEARTRWGRTLLRLWGLSAWLGPNRAQMAAAVRMRPHRALLPLLISCACTQLPQLCCCMVQDQVERMVRWATTEAVTPYDSSEDWRLQSVHRTV